MYHRAAAAVYRHVPQGIKATDAEMLHKAVLKHPNENIVRLQYADALREEGDEHGAALHAVLAHRQGPEASGEAPQSEPRKALLATADFHGHLNAAHHNAGMAQRYSKLAHHHSHQVYDTLSSWARDRLALAHDYGNSAREERDIPLTAGGHHRNAAGYHRILAETHTKLADQHSDVQVVRNHQKAAEYHGLAAEYHERAHELHRAAAESPIPEE